MRVQIPSMLFSFVLLPGFLLAQSSVSDSIPSEQTLMAITVLGSQDGLFQFTPGSADQLKQADLHALAPLSGNDAFRTITGVHVVDEEGAGLRMNLGIRGLDPDRSRSVLVMEDGIPVALGPYGEPEMYYTPAIERMKGVEVLKGSGQILYGPQTIGGVINYQTMDPPEDGRGDLRLRLGEGGLFHAQASYGGSTGQTGYLIHMVHKQADRLAYSGYRINDLSGKFTFRVSPSARLSAKIGVYDEWSDATYIGLTQTMYDRGDQDFVAMAPDDQLEVRRYAASVAHTWDFGRKSYLQTTLFGYTTTRNWQRQDFSSNPDAANATGVTWGDSSIPGGSVTMLESNGHRNRQFEVGGLESRVHHPHQLLGISQVLEGGARLMVETAYEQRVNGTLRDAASGALVQDEVRMGLAGSLFAQNRWMVSQRLSVTTGLRAEAFSYERDIRRNVFQGVARDTSIVAGSDLLTLIPGIGVNLTLAPGWTFFSGIHRGFAPPRIKDAVTSAGEALILDAETSWNTEIGIRHAGPSWWDAECTFFYMDFANQIIPVSESSGGTGSGLVNGGATLHYGLEAGGQIRLGEFLPAGHQLDLGASTTLLRAEYSSDRWIESDGVPVNIKGHRTPYAPEITANMSLRYLWKGQLGMQWTSRFTGDQFTDELNQMEAHPNGRTGQIASFWVHDVTAWWVIPGTSIELGASVKNVSNERYIATRRPQGIRLGLPRYFSGSIHYRF
ncbi:MAG: TonB-dependent receptor [Lewinellaceae bacterium]|nr:TonB-dependent receptor [Saprospiraceae bacterium]MCB9313631.1 TonB-dependent receptor [Lewinellaceae bacterium]HRW75288.1 TonB-dependent receptor [Saprospiraceae bacterium]